VRTLTGLAVWTLPFTLLWLGAWWAGWENSFNKGYEQAAVGPAVFLAGTLLSLPALTLLPHAVAHAAAEGRMAAYFALQTIARRARASGWSGVLLAVLSVVAAVPMFGFTALPVFVENIVPGFAALPPAEQARIGGQLHLAAAGWSFAALWFLRDRAARMGTRDAGNLATVWLVLSGLVWGGLMVIVVLGQFLNHATWRWISHPLWLLPGPV
jgi:hypothetical protein